MKTNTKYNSIFRLLVVAVLTTSLVSCGASRGSGFDDNDGIYSSSTDVETEDEDRNYYKQYFQTKAQAYSDIPEEEDVIFTDVEAYASADSYIDENGVIHEQNANYSDSYGPWGDSSEVTINVYSNPGWGYYGYWNTPHWWHRSGWGLSYWGYGYGWGSYYGPAWGWGYPHYWSSWGYPYYAHNPYYNPYYGGYSNYVAYNRGRRNTDINRSSRSVNRGTTNSDRSNRNYSRSEFERRINNSRSSQNVRNTTTQRSRNNRSIRTTPTTRNQNVRGTQNTRSTPNTTRSRTSTRNSGTTTRGSSTTTRSSGGTTTRSSGGGSTTRRGGGRG